MKVNKAFKIRIYPNKSQEVLLNKILGSCRFIYNNMLAERLRAYQELKDDKRALYEHNYKTEKDYKEEFERLKEIDAVALQQSRIDLSTAYQNFFNSLSGKRNGKSGFPKFHKKNQKNSYRTLNNNNIIRIDFNAHKLHLPKLGWISFKDSRSFFPGKIKSATISKTKTGKFFASVLFEQEKEIKQFNLEETLERGSFIKGLDMSLEHFYVDDCGRSPEYTRLYRKNESRLAYLQKKVSKKKPGSNNKSQEYGKLIIQADKWFASSKTCSTCGYINSKLKLSDREWGCPKCHTHHLRDMNAGINLREFGLNRLLTRLEQSVVPVEMSELSESKKQEAIESLA